MKTKTKFLTLAIIVMILNIGSWKNLCQGQSTIDTISSGTLLLTQAGTHEIYVTCGDTIWIKIQMSGASNFFWHDYCPGNCTDDSVMAPIASDYFCDFDLLGQPEAMLCHVYYLSTNTTTNTNVSICNGESYLAGGSLQSVSGIYYDTLQNTFGCDSVIVTNLTVNPIFTNNESISICQGDSVLLGGSYQSITGSYYDSLLSVNGCDSVIITQLTVNGYSAEFTVVIDSMTATYSPIDTADIMFWDFGGGVTSNTIAPIMIYAQPGYYTTCLTANDTISSCQAQYCENIQVGDTTDQCFANFTSDADVQKTQDVIFQDNSQGSPNMWYWKFGDGFISTDQHPQHNYNSAGIYNVELTIYDTITGCMDECEGLIEVTGSQDCEADFSVSVNNNNRKAYFSSTSISNGNIVSYFWDFGDGNTSTDENPMNHYQGNGYYSVCLYIITDSMCQNITCKQVQVGNNACLADFTWTLIDSANTIVQFTDQSIGNPNWWKWNFGDGSHADIPDTAYQYGGPGLYHVHYMIKGNGCHPSHKNDVVAIQSYNMTGMFGHYVDSSGNKTGAEPYPIKFMAAFWGDPSIWSWDFGDGTTEDVQQYPTHIYTDTGTYYVCLSISDFVSGYTSTYCDSINVKEVITGTGKEKTEPELLIYPNPSDGRVNIQSNSPSRISVQNFLGQIVLEEEIQSDARIFLSTPGIYLLVIQTDKQITTRKIIIE